MITFSFNYNSQPPGVFRNFKKANWSYFNHLLRKNEWINPPKAWSKITIEKEAEKLVKDIIQALDKVCPEKKRVVKPKPPSWWTNELTNLRGQLRAIKREWKRTFSDPKAD